MCGPPKTEYSIIGKFIFYYNTVCNNVHLICMDSENYFQLIRGTNSSKKNPGQPKEKIRRVTIRQAEHDCTTDIFSTNIVSKQLYHSL